MGGPTRPGVSLSASYHSALALALAWWVVHAPHDVAPVAPYVDVLRLGREDEGVDGKVGLQEAPVGLRLHHKQLDPLGGDAQVEPGGDLGDLEVWVRAEQQLRDDLLGLGGATLGVAGDDNVVLAEAEGVPDRRVEVVVVQLPGLLRPDRRFGRGFRRSGLHRLAPFYWRCWRKISKTRPILL